MKTIISNHIYSNRDTISEREIQREEKKKILQKFWLKHSHFGLNLNYLSALRIYIKIIILKKTTENEQFK